jgi:hypothetical protein
VTSAKIIIGIK